MILRKKFINNLLLITFIFTGVALANSSVGVTKIAYSAAAQTKPIAVGDIDCPNGGILLETGFDNNKNHILDLEEIETTEKICNGHNAKEKR